MALQCHVIDCEADAVHSDGAHHPADQTRVPTCDEHAMHAVDEHTPPRCAKFAERTLECSCPATRRDVRRYAIVDGKVTRADQGPLVGKKIVRAKTMLGGFQIEAPSVELLDYDLFRKRVGDRP